MVSRVPAYRLQLVRTGTVLAEQPECSSPRDAADLVLD